MTKEIDITPKTHAIASLRRQDMHPWLAICELVDNSIDAEASTVVVQWDPSCKCLSVTDDGVGAPNPAALVTIGDHDSEGRATSGRYGIGAKDAILALGTAAEVSVVRNGLRRVVRADFDEIRQSGRWVAREDQHEATESDATGTMVKVIGVDRKIYLTAVSERLSKTFAPALRRGCSIVVDGQAISAPHVVRVNDRREGVGEFRGKKYSWWAGIKIDGEQVAGGWRFAFKGRTLEENSCNRSYGTDGMDIHKFYGEITLVEPDDAEDDEKWLVNKHKTSADELQDLCEFIFPSIRDLLERCAEEHSLTLEAAIADEIGRGLTEALSDASRLREKRQRSDDEQPGTILPRNTGRKRRRASKTQDGNGSVTIRDPLTGKKFSIHFSDDDKFGSVTGSRQANVVYLGKLHPYWQAHAQDRDIVQCAAMAMLAGHAVTTEDAEQPIMSAIVSCDAANDRFFYTLGNIASQISMRQETAV
jgi:hypothetical protein